MSKLTSILTKIQNETVVVGGAVVAAGEGVLTAVPAGPVHNVAALVLPLVVSVVARAKVVPVGKYVAEIAALQAALKAAVASKASAAPAVSPVKPAPKSSK